MKIKWPAPEKLAKNDESETAPPKASLPPKGDSPKPAGPASKTGEAGLEPKIADIIHEQMIRRHVHSVSVHIPTGVIPMVGLFVFLSGYGQT